MIALVVHLLVALACLWGALMLSIDVAWKRAAR